MIRKFLDRIISFYLDSRQSGTTTLIDDISKSNKVWILVYNEESKNNFKNKENLISINELIRYRGLDKRPILVDNQLMIEICKSSINHIDNLKYDLDRTNNFIKNIHDEITKFRNG